MELSQLQPESLWRTGRMAAAATRGSPLLPRCELVGDVNGATCAMLMPCTNLEGLMGRGGNISDGRGTGSGQLHTWGTNSSLSPDTDTEYGNNNAITYIGTLVLFTEHSILHHSPNPLPCTRTHGRRPPPHTHVPCMHARTCGSVRQ